ncbi:hypothetical protein LNI90_11440 [Tenacibaculum dicentrarchi]|nr:hypothetical protein [Tenacibaculum dicentrarchi]MCD8452695.1 hypothetical protein [Tenacibaculum dicentrarchi]WBX67969.1 hypothetical protein PG910_07485 [Tenacibaculum dicentrarchi]
MRNQNTVFIQLIVFLFLISCKEEGRQFGIFRVLLDNRTIEMNGEISSTTLNDFNNLSAQFPNINQINIVNCDGSDDDEICLELALKIHQKEINIHLMDNGEISSGGVDFFLAGKRRTRGQNTLIGVHSWGGDDIKATDFPKGHEEHLFYINYYISIGFTKAKAEDFYYFTINSAPHNSMHDMTEEEINKYVLLRQ